jgi:ABC-type glutathione transport system ATPase component
MINLTKVGRPLAKIEGGKYNGMIVSVSDHFASNADDDEDKNGLIKEFRQLKIANDSKFQHIPDTTKEREILYITGPSGSGKSTYTRKYLEQYVKKFKSRPIYFFSVSRRTRASTRSSQNESSSTTPCTRILLRSKSSRSRCASSTTLTSYPTRRYERRCITSSTRS